MRALLLCVLTAAALVAGATPATAATTLTLNGIWEVEHDKYTVTYVWGFDYSPASNNLRAYTRMTGNVWAIHLQTEPLRLADRNGVLADRTVNSQTGLLETSTDPVSCHANGIYRSRLYFSVRWPDGVLTRHTTPIYEQHAKITCRH